MKKGGKYRFSLQFGSGTEKERKAGELLERLGNKKSVVIVEALNEYLSAHPELHNPDCRVEIKAEPGYDMGGIEKMVRAIVKQQLKTYQPEPALHPTEEEPETEAMENDVMQMLDNLDLFQ